MVTSRAHHRRVGKATGKRAMALCCRRTRDEILWRRGGPEPRRKLPTTPPPWTTYSAEPHPVPRCPLPLATAASDSSPRWAVPRVWGQGWRVEAQSQSHREGCRVPCCPFRDSQSYFPLPSLPHKLPLGISGGNLQGRGVLRGCSHSHHGPPESQAEAGPHIPQPSLEVELTPRRPGGLLAPAEGEGGGGEATGPHLRVPYPLCARAQGHLCAKALPAL